MKFNYLFILINLIIFNNIFVYSFEFINFIPYDNSECSGDISVYGIGFGIVLNTCFSLDNVTNHLIIKDEYSSSNQITVSSYYDIMGSTDCQVPIQQPPITATIGSCLLLSDFTFNSNLIPLGLNLPGATTGGTGTASGTTPIYFKITISNSSPFIPSNSYITSFMNDECNSSNILLLQYIINGTLITDVSKSNVYNFYCDENSKPWSQFCPLGVGKCFTPISTELTCFETIAFFNSSNEPLPNNDGSGTGSGINSVISGGSSSNSNTLTDGGGNNNNVVTTSISSGYSSAAGGDSGVTGSGTSGRTSGTGGGSGGSDSGGPPGIASTGGGSGGSYTGFNIDINNRYHDKLTIGKINNQSPSSSSSSSSYSSSYSSSEIYYKSVYCSPK